MKEIAFDAENSLIEVKDREGNLYNTHHIWTDGLESISCWKMTWRERLSALIFGKVWLRTRTGKQQPVVSLACMKEYFEEDEEDDY